MSVAAADEGVYRTSLTLATKSAPGGCFERVERRFLDKQASNP